MPSAAKHFAWRSNLHRSQTSAREMLRGARHDKKAISLPRDLYALHNRLHHLIGRAALHLTLGREHDAVA